MKTRRAAIYLRVLTTDQNTDNHEHELVELAARAGWTVTNIYKDRGIWGAKGRDRRPAFDTLLSDARSRKFDIAWPGAAIGSAARFKT